MYVLTALLAVVGRGAGRKFGHHRGEPLAAPQIEPMVAALEDDILAIGDELAGRGVPSTGKQPEARPYRLRQGLVIRGRVGRQSSCAWSAINFARCSGLHLRVSAVRTSMRSSATGLVDALGIARRKAFMSLLTTFWIFASDAAS